MTAEVGQTWMSPNDGLFRVTASDSRFVTASRIGWVDRDGNEYRTSAAPKFSFVPSGFTRKFRVVSRCAVKYDAYLATRPLADEIE